MHIILEQLGTIASLERSLHAAMAAPGVRSLYVLACEENRYPLPALDALLRGLSVPVFGGLFPAILHGRKKLTTGSLVVGLPQETTPHVIHGLSDPAADYVARLERTLDDGLAGRTLLVLVDGLSSRIVSFVEALFCLHGLEGNYLGGGAGSLSFRQQPCLITNAGLVADAGVVVALDSPSSVAVGLGWRPLHEDQTAACFARHCPGPCKTPLKATEVQHNAIISLDWEPALEVYGNLVRCHAGEQLSRADVFAMAKSYPLGITRLDDGIIVRDPLYLTPDGHLLCVGEIPPGAFMEVLHGSKESLIQAAAAAAVQVRRPPASAPALCLVMDCISRVLFLGADFSRELDSLQMPDVPLVGACSIGEIANTGRRRVDFHNKACVVGILEQV